MKILQMLSTTLQIYIKYVGCNLTDMKEKSTVVEFTLVEQRGVEPLTSSVRGMRSPN